VKFAWWVHASTFISHVTDHHDVSSSLGTVQTNKLSRCVCWQKGCFNLGQQGAQQKSEKAFGMPTL